jgi:hypothetical protein
MDSSDMTNYWLPLHCFMGSTLRGGHIPGWNPFAMGGMPFAPDPQAGWMSLPAMAFFTALPCGVAIRWLMIALTASTGLAMYWFLRGEGARRLVAAVGGLVLVIAVAGSGMATTFRFPGAITFTVLTLGAMGRMLRATRWSRPLLWLAIAAVCFGQLAASFLGLGLIVGAITLVAYLAATIVPRIRSGEWSTRVVVLLLAAAAAAFVLVNLAYLLPRLAYASRINLSLGYGGLTDVTREDLGRAPPFPGFGTAVTWPLNLALVPGRYLGGVLVLAFAGFWSKRKPLVWAFAAVGALCYLASLQVVVDHVPHSIWGLNVVDQYLHRPFRMVFGVFVPVAVLVALGLEAWLQARSGRTRIAMLAPGLLVWFVAPLVLGAPIRRELVWVAGVTAAVGLMVIARRRPPIAMAIAPILAVELMASALFVRPVFTFEPVSRLLHPVPYPTVGVDEYLTPTPIAEALRGVDGRYLSLGVRWDRRALSTNQGMLYGIDSTQGYLSVQLLRYWLFVRAVSDTPQSRQYAFFRHPPPALLDLLRVNALVVPEGPLLRGVEPASKLLASDGEWRLYLRPTSVPLASAIFNWTVVGSAEDALRTATAEGFDVSRTAVLEQDPGIRAASQSNPTASVTGRDLGPQAAQIEVDVSAPAVILVRNVFDPTWHVTVDGRPAPLLAVDSVVQGVAVPAGRHTIDLRYDDPTVGLGMAVSLVTLVVLVGAIIVLRRRERGSAPHPDSPALAAEPPKV